MDTFKWHGKNRQGKKVKGELEALSESIATLSLRKQGISDLKVRKKPKDIEIKIPFIKAKVPEKDVVVFTRQFATMINSGLPIIQCLEIQSSQQENKEFKNCSNVNPWIGCLVSAGRAQSWSRPLKKWAPSLLKFILMPS